ncbi:hypothetical protein B5X24_HaOG215615 [Helicoverpa armigera]|nr:hypothetical protein B5X24_HaOG215615 [Helicoverpa armigera]
MRFIQCAFLFILAMLVVDITASPQLLQSLLQTSNQRECDSDADCRPWYGCDIRTCSRGKCLCSGEERLEAIL